MKNLFLIIFIMTGFSAKANESKDFHQIDFNESYGFELPKKLKAVHFSENVFRAPFEEELQKLILNEMIKETGGKTKKIDAWEFLKRVEKEAKKRDLNFEGLRDEMVEIFSHPYNLNSLNKSVSISGSTTKDSNGRSRASISVSGSKKVNGVKVSGSISNTTTTTQSGNTNTSTTARVTITFP